MTMLYLYKSVVEMLNKKKLQGIIIKYKILNIYYKL